VAELDILTTGTIENSLKGSKERMGLKRLEIIRNVAGRFVSKE